VPANAGSDVAFLPLDDARLSRSLDEVIARRSQPSSPSTRDAAMQSATATFVAKVRAVEAGEGAGQHRPVRSGRPLLLQADGLQGRIRSRAPVHQRRFPEAPPQQQFEGDYTLHFNLAPPLLAKKNAARPAGQEGIRPAGCSPRSS
jgi:indolepyruvate ferredoxin oxidoreductase